MTVKTKTTRPANTSQHLFKFRDSIEQTLSVTLNEDIRETPENNPNRFYIPGGKPGNKDGWYYFHVKGDFSHGSYGSNRGTQEKHTWTSKTKNTPTAATQPQAAPLQNQPPLQQPAQLTKQNSKAEKWEDSKRLWKTGDPITEQDIASCPYIVDKKVSKIQGIRRVNIPYGYFSQFNGNLLIPFCDVKGTLRAVQRISHDYKPLTSQKGDPRPLKQFLSGSSKQGNFFKLHYGELAKAETICICEGWSTTASVFEATGYATICAGDSGNLLSVARALKTAYPKADFILCADNDCHGEGANAGVQKATEAAREIDAKLAIPKFKTTSDAIQKPTDMNDKHCLEGLPAVKAQIDAAEYCTPMMERLDNDVRGLTAEQLEKQRKAIGAKYGITQEIVKETWKANQPKKTKEKEQPRQTPADLLIEIAQGYEFFHCQKTGYARFKNTDHTETWAIKSPEFSKWMRKVYYQITKKGLSDQNIKTALETLEAKALFDGEKKEIYLRHTCLGRKHYIDMCGDDWRVIEITNDGWKILHSSETPVYFIRNDDMEGFPEPIENGKLSELMPLLKKYFNVSDDASKLILTYLLAGLGIATRCAILSVKGEQDSGKSTALEFIRKLIDPSATAICAAPKTERDLAAIARDSKVMMFDNVSNITQDISDALCRYQYGTSNKVRKLYTTSETESFFTRNIIALNGLTEVITKSDAIRRCIFVEFLHFEDGKVKDDEIIKAEFEIDSPKILGLLFDVAVKVLQQEESKRKSKKGEVPAFGALGDKIEAVLDDWGKGSFGRAYDASIAEGNISALENAFIGETLREFARNRAGYEGYKETPDKFWEELSDAAGVTLSRFRFWPQSPSSCSKMFKKLIPNMRAVGFKCSLPKTDGVRYISIVKIGKH